MSWALGELALRFGCELRGDPACQVDHVATLAEAGERGVSFLTNPLYRRQLAQTRAGAVILTPADLAGFTGNALITRNPHACYARIAQLLHPAAPVVAGVHVSAVVEGAHVDSSAQISAGAILAPGVRVGARAFVGPGSVVSAGALIGADTRLMARVFVGSGVQVGERCLFHAGVVLGSDGFGFANEGGRWVKVPQIGSVRIGDDVEIGANTTIDRGAIGDTVIEEGVKLDNLIQIAHNVRIGAHTIIAAGTGVSGSTTIGKRCMIGGMVGFAGHIEIGDDVIIAGKTSVTNSLREPGMYSSVIPPEPVKVWRRLAARFKRLEQMAASVKRLERGTGTAGVQDPEQEE